MDSPAPILPSLLETIARCCPEAIVVNDRRGDILSFNANAEAVFGCRADEVVGKRNVAEPPPRP